MLQAGLAITPGPFVAAAIAGPFSRLALRIGYRPVVVAGGLIWGAGLLWIIARVGPEPAYVEEWLPGLVLLGVGAGITFPNVSAAAVASAPGESFATATGVSSVVRQVGAAIGVASAVAILGTPDSLQAAMSAFDDAWTFAAACLDPGSGRRPRDGIGRPGAVGRANAGVGGRHANGAGATAREQVRGESGAGRRRPAARANAGRGRGERVARRIPRPGPALLGARRRHARGGRRDGKRDPG